MKKLKAFDTQRLPLKPQSYLVPIEWAGTIWFTAPVGGKINKVNCENLKPPYLVLIEAMKNARPQLLWQPLLLPQFWQQVQQRVLASAFSR